MPGKIVYRSTHPDVLAALASYDQDFQAYKAAIRAILDGAGLEGCKIWATTGGWDPGRFLGIDVPEGEPPPAGWRTGRQFAIPDKRYAAGKRMAAALKALKHPGDPMARIPGMPPDILTPGGFATPGMERMGGALYVIWGRDPEIARGSFTAKTTDIDPALWTRLKLSEYYAAREAEDAKRELADAS